MPSRPSQSRAAAFAVAWLAYFVVLQWSVVRFRVPIVLVLTACALALAAWQWRRSTVEPTPRVVTAMLAGSALATLAVPLFSYLGDTGLAVATTALVVGALAAGALLWSGHERAAVPALATGVTAYAVAGATAVISDTAPKIDVWVTLQQASDALARGENFYDMSWTGSPGIQDAFTYLPFTTVLLAPGKWLAGDVRWALLVWTLVAAAGAWVLATRLPRGHAAYSSSPGPRWRGAAVVALLLLAPGTLTQLDQAWTEPLLLAGLVWWAVLVDRGTERSRWWAIVPLALACASKQHLAVLLPVLLVWRPFGFRRTIATGALTGLFIAPWFLASPSDFLHDTVTLLVSFPPLKFANTLYLLALNTFGVMLPFWVTGLVVLGTLGTVVALVWRRQPPLAEVLRWLALVLLVANLVNKQAFYNQFWLAGALVVVSLALAARPAVSSAPDPAGRTATHA